MQKVSSLIRAPKVEGDIGLEIECEGDNLKEVANAYWKSVDDGSLRGVYPETRAEYVFAKPQPVDKVEVLVKHLKETLKDANFNFSYRTSVHVHVNVQTLEYQQLLAMMYAYYLIEEPLTNFAGKKRKGNNFCLRLQDAEGVLATIQKMILAGEQGIDLIEIDRIRYSAMNIESIRKYGSLEFRAMEGNIDPKRIQTWCSALVNLREYARKADSPEAVYEDFKGLGASDFFCKVVGMDIGLNLHYPRLFRDMDKSFSITIDIPYAFRQLKERMKVEKKKELSPKVGDIVSYVDAIKLNQIGKYRFEYLGADRYEVIVAPAKIAPIVPPLVFEVFEPEAVQW